MAETLHPVVAAMQPSSEQLPAVLARGCDVVVTAGAGTGKTRTLTARALSLLADGAPLPGLVAVTFTRKAAREMRSRIRTQVRKALAGDSLAPHERARWDEIYRDLDAARIGTIHSLCSEILRSHPAEARIDPNFAMLDEAQAAALQRQAVEDTLLWAVESPDTATLFVNFSAEQVRGLMISLLRSRLDTPRALSPECETAQRALLEQIAARTRQLLSSGMLQTAMADVRAAWTFAQSSDAAQNDATYPVITNALSHWQTADEAAARGQWLETAAALVRMEETFNLQAGRKKTWAPHDPKTALGNVRSALRETLPDLDESDPLVDLRHLELLPALRALFAEAVGRYSQTKRLTHALDFDDLELLALALLRDHTPVRTLWQQSIHTLLVDEFQDTNQRQRDLVRLLAGAPGRLFVVGDAKQSIYRFRGADVSVFRAERSAIEAEGGLLADLSVSYRTHAPLLNTMNTLLEPVLGTVSAVPWREPFAALTAHRPAPAVPLAAPFVEFHLARGPLGKGALFDAARGLTHRLVSLFRAGVPWGQIAILCRRAAQFQPYEDALEEAGIPYVTVAGAGFYDRPEVRDLLNALRAVADPQDDLALVGLLRSPMVGMSDTDLLDLEALCAPLPRRQSSPGRWWAALQQSDHARARACVTLVNRLHSLAGRTDVADLLKALLDETHYTAALLHNGQSRAARNLVKLLEDAQSSAIVSVGAFLETITEARSSGTREGEARAEAEGAVQIMTVHAAKGLEFDVVVIGAAASPGGPTPSILLDPEMGLVTDLKLAADTTGFLYKRAAQRAGEMEKAEAQRLLYVAATRARDLLIFSANLGSKSPGGWLGEIAKANSLRDLFATLPAEPAQPIRVEHPSPALAITLYPPGTPPTPPPPPTALPAAPSRPAAFNPDMVSPLKVTPHPGLDQPHRPWTVVPETRSDVAPRWVLGEIVHAALAAWRFPHNDPAFADWVALQARATGIADEAQIRRLVERSEKLLDHFRRSVLFRAINSAERYPELPFALEEQTPHDADQPGDGRGQIDLLYRDSSGWHIVDYKIDQLKFGTKSPRYIEKLPDYKKQVRRYGRAVQQLLGVTPTLTLCYLDFNGRIHTQRVTAEEMQPLLL